MTGPNVSFIWRFQYIPSEEEVMNLPSLPPSSLLPPLPPSSPSLLPPLSPSIPPPSLFLSIFSTCHCCKLSLMWTRSVL